MVICMHIEIYTIKGRKYKYDVTNYRVGKKVKHKKTYVGPVVPVNKKQRGKSTGRKPFVFVRELSLQEKQIVEKAVHSSKAFSHERAKMILLSAEGLKVQHIAEKTGRDKRSVLAAIRAFNKSGTLSLCRGKSTGAKPKFTDAQRAKIVAVINTDPRKLGKTFTTWSLQKIRAYVVAEKIVDSISIENLRRILLKNNKKYKKSRKWLYSNDPDFLKKKFS